MAVQVEPPGSGSVTSRQFYEFKNPSPGYPHLHHEGRSFFVNAHPAAGYEFDHWQVSRRKSKGNITTTTPTVQLDMLVSVIHEGKAIPVYLVAFFRKADVVQDTAQPSTPLMDSSLSDDATDEVNPGPVAEQSAHEPDPADVIMLYVGQMRLVRNEVLLRIDEFQKSITDLRRRIADTW